MVRSQRKHRLAGSILAAGALLVGGAAVFGCVSARDNPWDFMREQAAQSESAPVFRAPAFREPAAVFRAPAFREPAFHEPGSREYSAPSRPRTHAFASNGLARRAVCVRLCDGYFFPTGNIQGENSAAAEESTCAGLCPGAPTRVYVVPPGGEGIEGAVSRDGHPYSALSVALRYTKTIDNTCSCKRSIETRAIIASLTRDVTLRRGDVVMTPKGLLVFNGARSRPYQRGDFATLAEARSRIGNADSLALLDSVAQLSALAAGESAPVVPPATHPTALPVVSVSDQPPGEGVERSLAE